MARANLNAIRFGPTRQTTSGSLETIASYSLATLTSGMSNNDQIYVQAVVILFDPTSAPSAYAEMFTMTVPLRLTSGPTYTLGTVTLATINPTSGASAPSTIASAGTIDQSGGSLRVRATYITNDSSDAYVVLSTFSP